MKNSKRSEPRDRLSELPDSIIFEIFWLLPAPDVVRTTVLSARWRNLWTTSPFLDFCHGRDHYLGKNLLTFDEYSYAHRDFVNRVLLRWDGARILKFTLGWYAEIDSSIYSDIDSWLGFAKRNGVEELYFHLTYHTFIGEFDCMYWIPQFLYSCSSFKKLYFNQCNLGVNGNVQWNHLKELEVEEGFAVTGHVVSQILCGSPLLKVLIMSFVEIGESYSIRSTSLKELTICKRFLDATSVFMDTELSIWTPNLEELEIRGVPFGKCLLLDISSLNYVTLGISGLHCYEDEMMVFPGIDAERGVLSTTDFLGDQYCRIFPLIQHVEYISLLFCCIEVLEAMNKRWIHSLFPNVRFLQIGERLNAYEKLVHLLQIFPQLERLVLRYKGEDGFHEKPEQLNFDVKFESNLPESFLFQLRAVKVTWLDEGDNIFPFVELLLKYATKLEKMVFRVREVQRYASSSSPPSNLLPFASQKLSQMPISSPSCTVDILHDLVTW